MNFEKIAGYLGHFVLSSEGAIVSSGGDLGSFLIFQNSEYGTKIFAS
jgi:hypothetical protein